MKREQPTNKPPSETRSVTDQYRDAAVTITTGHEPDLQKVRIPIYSAEEHETWALMYDRQIKALPNRATPEYLAGLKILNLPQNRIPRLKEVSASLEKVTGWKLTRVEGLVPEREFFECLAHKLFPCTDFIRKRDELEYTPSPDMFHDIFGHIPLITNPEFASFYEYYGKVALKANADQLIKLQRIYWFSVEFGLIQKPEGLRIYGSGILSSPGEVPYALSSKVRVHPWDFSVVEKQYFEIHHMQDDIFVINSFESLLTGFKAYAKKSGLL
ncbi:MAG: Phenylalanine 4-monooxygenase [Bacteriovoracaceae bacterium]|nr:Phenylalanine 4-monooxygenase [Bacteriovoracaceae bacterium]